MAIYRNISTTFWTDSKVADDFSADDKYFYLYLFTNPHTNLCGCYEISFKQIAYEASLSVDKVKKLVNRLQNNFNVIRYNNSTKEVLIINWHRYNWTSSEKFRKPLLKEIEKIKDANFKCYLLKVFNGEDIQFIDRVSEKQDRVSDDRGYPTDTTVTVSVTDTVSDTVSVSTEIVDYLNEICGTHYKGNTKKTKDLIKARLKEGFTVDDFKKVIYKKAKQWQSDPKMCKFLRPETLFGSKFESYLNEKETLTFAERIMMA